MNGKKSFTGNVALLFIILVGLLISVSTVYGQKQTPFSTTVQLKQSGTVKIGLEKGAFRFWFHDNKMVISISPSPENMFAVAEVTTPSEMIPFKRIIFFDDLVYDGTMTVLQKVDTLQGVYQVENVGFYTEARNLKSHLERAYIRLKQGDIPTFLDDYIQETVALFEKLHGQAEKFTWSRKEDALIPFPSSHYDLADNGRVRIEREGGTVRYVLHGGATIVSTALPRTRANVFSIYEPQSKSKTVLSKVYYTSGAEPALWLTKNEDGSQVEHSISDDPVLKDAQWINGLLAFDYELISSGKAKISVLDDLDRHLSRALAFHKKYQAKY